MSGSVLSRRSITLALVIGLGAGIVACKKSGDADTAGAVDTGKIAEAGLVYGFPLVMNYGVLYESFINTASPQYRGPINTIINTARVFTPKDTAVVTPNSDTPYSFAQLDLRAEPMVICVPAIPKERYYSVQLIDMNTMNYGYIGSRTTGNDAGCFMVAGPDWKGETPKGIKAVYNSNTQFSMALFRTQLFNPADIDNVKAIQAGYKLQSLSGFAGTPAPAAAPAINWPAIDKDKAKTGFFDYLAFLLQFIPAQANEAGIRADLAKIGVEAGKPFDMSKLSMAQKAGMLAGMKAGNDKVAKAATSMGKTQNGWNVAKIENTTAATGDDWLRRAAVAQAGIYANDYQEALYPMARTDGAGVKLDGSTSSYTITFPGNALPPVNAFWSVTMYDGKTQLLIDNPINRYLINSPMLPDLKKNPDGGFTIYVSNKSPGADKESNWLPAPNGEIYMVMRLYWPKLDQLEGWQPPAVVKAN
ncbi:DUF1254 domain-containing protein [Polymorphobacter arshaanensis]|uniref:DUF1254 domain-containing protein n=1 Tax=Glacieibacterium arshaanense TaxID=2511025 RepID=A0A4Y9EKK5_9SPHN|nr:DUF1254 domain-containing protein [Polymorphobacter arshaanensis]TFU01291.1 DUF1254 domain-containing protein [Polymorphobacter arshaanensis]